MVSFGYCPQMNPTGRGTIESETETQHDIERRLFLHRLKNGMQRGSPHQIAADTLNYIRKIVVSGKYISAEELIKSLETERSRLLEALPYQFVVSNTVLSVIKVICEESGRSSAASSANLVPHDSLNELWKASSSSKKTVNSRELRKSAIAAINELATEIDTCIENMCAQASDHICTSDVIITHSLSMSSTLSAFFNSARKSQKNFRVLVVDEEIDSFDCLSSVDVLTAMQRATRVVITAASVFPDGSCLAPAGCLMICLAAKRHSVPVCICAPFYKFTPFFVSDIDRVLSFGSAADVIPFSEIDEELEEAQLVNPVFDLIPAELISLYISHTSAFTPSHVYRFIGDYYCRDRTDMSL